MDTLIVALYRRRRWLWLAAAVPAAVLAGLILVVLPPKQTLGNLADWAFRLSPFALAVLTVALLPRWRFGPALLLASTFVYIGGLDTVGVLRILAFGEAPPADQSAAFEPIYQFELLTATFVVLSGLLAYRLGGARTAAVLKLGVAALLVVISGLNDVTFWLTYHWPHGRPDHFDWASHIAVFVGGSPGVATAIVFMIVHCGLAIAVMFVPLGRIVDRAVDAAGRVEVPA
jgi:hypothetical protein